MMNICSAVVSYFAQNISIQRTVANTRDKVLIRQPRIAVFVFWMLKSHQNRSKSDKKAIFRLRFFCPKKSIPISGYRLLVMLYRGYSKMLYPFWTLWKGMDCVLQSGTFRNSNSKIRSPTSLAAAQSVFNTNATKKSTTKALYALLLGSSDG